MSSESVELDEAERLELWVFARKALRKGRYVEVLRSSQRSYWKRRDGAYALLEALPNGEPHIEHLNEAVKAS